MERRRRGVWFNLWSRWLALHFGPSLIYHLQGAYAEYIVAPEIMLLPKPEKLSWVEAASIPEVWMTGKYGYFLRIANTDSRGIATQALALEAPLKEGQNVLIHAGASGVGIAAIQIACECHFPTVYEIHV